MTSTATKGKKPRTKKTLPKTKITIVLDRSGSMGSCREQTIAGFNELINGQRDVKGEVSVTLVQFDDRYEVNFANEPLDNVPDLNVYSFVPRGSTALNDAIGRGIHETAKSVKPGERVLFVIITDGYENSSREFNLEAVTDLIREKEKGDWTFMFMGADIDAFATAQSYHIPAGNTLGYSSTPQSTGASFSAASAVTNTYLNSNAASADSLTASVANTEGVKTAFDDDEEEEGSLKPKA